jgi:hypothetical protein
MWSRFVHKKIRNTWRNWFSDSIFFNKYNTNSKKKLSLDSYSATSRKLACRHTTKIEFFEIIGLSQHVASPNDCYRCLL